MNTITILNKLRNIDTKILAKDMGVGINMAGKYKRTPEKHTPNIIQAQIIFKKHKIPICFWQDIKSSNPENIQKPKPNGKV